MVRLKPKKSSSYWLKTLSCLLLLLLFFLASVFFFRRVKNSFFFFLKKVNFVLIGENQLAVFSYQGKESSLISLSSSSIILVPRGFGEYELGKVYPLGELEKKGGKLLTETLQNSLNLPVMGYFYSSSFNFENFSKISDFNRLVLGAMGKKVKTDLKITDLVVIYFQTKKLNNNFFQKKQYEKEKASQLFKDELVRKEAISVEILNATSYPGLAQKGTDFWENLGGRVVRVGDYSENLAKTKLVVRGKSKNSYSYQIIKSFFEIEEEFDLQETSRAEMSLILGEDYWKIMAEKW